MKKRIGPLHITAYGSTGRMLKEKIVLRNVQGQALVSVQLCERKKGPPSVDQKLRGAYLAELVSSAERMVEALEAMADAESPVDNALKATIRGMIAPTLKARQQWEGFNEENQGDSK